MATVDQFLFDLDQAIRDLERDGAAFGRAVAEVHRTMANRIFEQHQKADGSPIGRYSTKPAYYKRPGGKKSKFYEGGYAAFKEDIGRQGDEVDLQLEGNLRNGFRTGLSRLSNLEWEVRFSNRFDNDKAAWMEEKYGEIFGAMDSEVDLLSQVYAAELQFLEDY